MIHAYQEIYLGKAQSVVGEAFDYAINACGISGEDFIGMFSVSPYARRLECGESAVLAGKSGAELALEIVRDATGGEPAAAVVVQYERSIEYWIGWAAAYYQWWSGNTYRSLFEVFTFEDLHRMYYTLHEADISKFAEIVDDRRKMYYPETNLKRLRGIFGCSQAELAKISGVSLRPIQMYEQRNKDINKASAETVYRLAQTLGCSMEALLER